jgi:hypothetical protein
VPTKSRKTTKGHKPARERGRSASPAQAKAQNAPTQESQDVELWIDEDLTAQQERFVNELCADPRRNGTRAAMLAYPNQNYQSARSEAKRQLQNPKVRAAIDRRLGALARLTRTSIEEVTRTKMNRMLTDKMEHDIGETLEQVLTKMAQTRRPLT